MIDREYTCLAPFVNLILTCDICGEVTNGTEGGIRRLAGPVGQHVVHLQDGRTICKPCFWRLARTQ